MWENLQSQVLKEAGPYAGRLIAALIILGVGVWLAKLVRRYLNRVLSTRKLDSTVLYFVDNCVQVLLYGFVIIAVIHELGVETNALVAVLGAAGLAIGFALKGQLSNVASGLLIILFRPISVGDYIESGGSSGTVEKIQLMSTEISTPDNLTVIIPNSKLTSEKVVNYSARDTRRVDILIGVAYEADLLQTRKVLEDIISEDHRILEDPQPNITITDLTETGVRVEIRLWVKSQDNWQVKVDTFEKIKQRFDSQGIPFARGRIAGSS